LERRNDDAYLALTLNIEHRTSNLERRVERREGESWEGESWEGEAPAEPGGW
jgi:hypothetical protein